MYTLYKQEEEEEEGDGEDVDENEISEGHETESDDSPPIITSEQYNQYVHSLIKVVKHFALREFKSYFILMHEMHAL